MKQICFLLIAFLFIQKGSAQSNVYREGIPHKIKIDNKENITLNKGILYSVTDTSVILISEEEYHRFKSNLDIEKKIVIPVNQIDYLIVWKKNRFGRVLTLSTGIGATVGAIAGYADGADGPGYVSFNENEKALLGGIGGAFFGALAGCFIGSTHVRIHINKNKEKFISKKDFLARRSALKTF